VRQTLQKKEILRGYQSFSHVLSGGKPYQHGIVRCFVFLTTKEEPGVKVGFTLVRGVQSAARRNRVKRLLRESYRRNKQILSETASLLGNELHMVFLVVPDKKGGTIKSPSYQDIEMGVRALLKQIESVIRTTVQ
jgi:ribonuclease P protein component